MTPPIGKLISELRDDYPAVDVTTVVFSRDFAGIGCCVIPQDRVLAIINSLEVLATALLRIRSLGEKNVPKYAQQIARDALERGETAKSSP